MLSTVWSAPAGFLGEGGADLRSYAVGCAVRPDLGGAVAPVHGTGAPFAGPSASGLAVRQRATGLPTTGMPLAQQFAPITPNDGTTLGNPSSRRPLS